MADPIKPIQSNTQHENSNSMNNMNNANDPISRVKEDVERLVEEFDLQAIARKVDEFGRQNPVGLAIGALSLGVVVGLLMRPPQKQMTARKLSA